MAAGHLADIAEYSGMVLLLQFLPEVQKHQNNGRTARNTSSQNHHPDCRKL